MFIPTLGPEISNNCLVLYEISVAFKNDCDAALLYSKTIDICNYLDLLLVLPFSTVIFCLPYGTHYVEQCRILPDNVECSKIEQYIEINYI